MKQIKKIVNVFYTFGKLIVDDEKVVDNSTDFGTRVGDNMLEQ